MAQRIGKYKVSKREAELSAVDGAEISGDLSGISNLTANGTSTLTTVNVSGVTTLTGAAVLTAGSTTILPSLVGMTVSGSIATHSAIGAAADTIHLVNYAGDAAATVTLPAATAGARVVFICTVDTTGGTGKLIFDCAGSDVLRTGSVIESRNSNATTFDTSTADETQIQFTPANNANNYVSQGSRFVFWCSTAGTWDVHLEAKDNPAGTGLLGATAFAS